MNDDWFEDGDDFFDDAEQLDGEIVDHAGLDEFEVMIITETLLDAMPNMRPWVPATNEADFDDYDGTLMDMPHLYTRFDEGTYEGEHDFWTNTGEMDFD